MPAKILYSSGGRGNTVPYPPLQDEIRRNHGFVDLRTNPAAVANIPEAKHSPALANLLVALAQPHSVLISLGCDLGEHSDPTSRLQTRRRAGGYVQIADARMRDAEGDFLKRAAAHIEAGLKAAADSDRWNILFDLSGVAYEFNGRVEAHSIWIWFDAMASTFDKARASRERLLNAIATTVTTFSLTAC